MGLSLSVSCGSDAVEIRLTNAETEGIKTLQPTLSADVETVFGVDDFGQPREVPGEAFAHAVQNLLKVVEAVRTRAGFIISKRRIPTAGGATLSLGWAA